jgi:hypothetical protein
MVADDVPAAGFGFDPAKLSVKPEVNRVAPAPAAKFLIMSLRFMRLVVYFDFIKILLTPTRSRSSPLSINGVGNVELH